MNLRKSVLFICLAAGAASLALGYSSFGALPALGAAGLCLAAWLLAYRSPSRFEPAAALVLTVAVAAAGLLIGAASFPLLLASALALAAWDLVRLERIAGCIASPSPGDTDLLVRAHYSSLALVLALGLLIPLAGHALHLALPFEAMAVLIVLILFSLDRVWRGLAR